MVLTGNGESGFDSGEGALKTATTSKEGSRHANYPIPGLNDPCRALLPQEPIHNQIFNFNNTYNPDIISMNNNNILVSSGSNVEDILKYRAKSRNVG